VIIGEYLPSRESSSGEYQRKEKITAKYGNFFIYLSQRAVNIKGR
jgi:hypothetical protein